MKIIKVIFLLGMALALIVTAGIFIFFQTFDTDVYLSRLTAKASKALGRPVSVGHISLGLSREGISLDAGPVLIGDDADFTTQSFVSIERVRLGLDSVALMKSHALRITDVVLQSPVIHIIRSQQGVFNVGSLLRRNVSAADTNGLHVKTSTAAKALPLEIKHDVDEGKTPVSIKRIIIQDASISYIDQNETMPLDIWLSGIDGAIDHFSLTQSFQLSFTAAAYSNQPNVQGSAVLSVMERSINDAFLQMDFLTVDTEVLKGISPVFTDGAIFKNAADVLKPSGAAAMKVRIDLAHLDAGSLGNVTANGNVTITGGMLKNFNIIKTAVSRTLGVFLGLGDSSDGLFSGRLKDKLGSDDTILEKAEFPFSFKDKTLMINDASIETNSFDLTAKGSIDGQLNVDMQTKLRFNEAISAALVGEFDSFKMLMDDSHRIAIGGAANGVIPHVAYKLNKDFRKKAKRALLEEGGNILGTFLGKRGN